MKGVCPKCGSRFNLDQAVDELRQLVWEYTDCFRQTEFGDVMPKTRWRLLKEIARLFETCTFQVRGKRYRSSRHEIVKAMTAMCNRNVWGIKTHGYLCAILMKTADRLSAEGLSAREEQAREIQRAEGRGQRAEEFVGLSGEEQRRKIVGIINGLGKEENLEKR